MEEIGLKAIMDMVGFSAGIKAYNQKIGEASGTTDKGASAITKAFGTISKVAMGLAAGGIATLTAAVIGGIKVFSDWAGKVDDVGDVLGTTAEESSALAVAAESIGGDVTQLAGQMAKLTQGLFDANGELGPTGKLMDELGIAFRDANGNLLPTTEIIQNVADKVGVMDDGLEKTDLMMQLFGKSGKDMSDMLGILANGGMEQMNEKAKQLGLSMSDDATEGAVKFGRSMNDLKLMGKGLLVTIGSELLPILQPLIDQFFKLAIEAVPHVKRAIQEAIPVIQDIFKWIGENLIPIVQDLVAWFIEHVPPAVQKAVEFFNTYLLPAIKDIWAFVKDPLLPILGDIAEWLLTAIGNAVEFAVPIIGKIYTAFYDVWKFVYNTLIPILGDIIEWLIDTVGSAVTTFTGIWNKVSKAFKDVWSFISENVIPIFEKVINFLSNLFTGPINKFVTGAWGTLVGAFKTARDIISDIVGFFERLIGLAGQAIGAVQGFVASALAGIDEVESSGGGKPSGPSGPRRNTPKIMNGATSAGGGSVMVMNNNNVVINLNASINNGMDLESFRVMVLDTVSGALR